MKKSMERGVKGMSLRHKMKIDKGTDFVVLLSDCKTTASVLILQGKRAVRVDAAVWSEAQWERYINRRIKASEAGHPLGMKLLKNEK